MNRALTSPLSISLFLSTATLAACSVSPRGEPPAQVQSRSAALTLQQAPIGTEAPTPIQYSTGDYMSVASSGSENLVVFYDGGVIRGLRYDQSGTVLDLDAWINLGENGGSPVSQAYTDLAYGGGVYMVVYIDFGETAPGLYVQAIDPSGEILSEPALVQAGSYYGAVTFNGTDFSVAWCDGDVGLVRVGLDGSVLEDTKAQVTNGSVTNRPVLTMADGVGLVVFEQDVNETGRKVYAARFTPEGEVLDPGGQLISGATTSSVDVSVAAGTTEFMVVWGGSGDAIYGSVVGLDGSLPRSEFLLSRSGSSLGGSAIAFDGTQYLVAWENRDGDENVIEGTRISASGEFVDGTDTVLASGSRASQSWGMDLQWTGTHYALVYNGEGIEGHLLDADLNELVPGPLELSPLPNSQYLSSVTYDGEAYVVGYSHELDHDTNDQVKSVRIDASGTIVEPGAVLVSSNSGGGLAWNVSLASNRQNTMYAYTVYGDTTETFTRMQEGAGELSAPVALGSLDGSTLQIASNGTGYLGIFDAGDNGNGNPAEIWGQLFDATGSVSGEVFLIKEMSRPRVGIFASGDGYLLIYSGQEISGTDITGSAITLNGAGEEVTDFGPVAEGSIFWSAASSGQQSLVVWEDRDRMNVFGRLLDHESGWGDVIALASDLDTGGAAVAWDGEQFMVVWSHSRMALWSRNVTPDGSLTAAEEILAGDYVSPALTAGKEGQLLLSYVHYTNGARARRVESRLVGDIDAPIVPEDEEDEDPMTDPEGDGSGGEADPGETDPVVTATGGQVSEGAGGTTTAVDPGAENPTEETPDRTALSNSNKGSPEKGCSVAAPGNSPSTWPLLGLLLAAGALVRRRRAV